MKLCIKRKKTILFQTAVAIFLLTSNTPVRAAQQGNPCGGDFSRQGGTLCWQDDGNWTSFTNNETERSVMLCAREDGAPIGESCLTIF